MSGIDPNAREGDYRRCCALHQDAYAYEVVKYLHDADCKRSRCFLCGRPAEVLVDITKQDHASD